MSAKGSFHQIVKNALVKDGWKITHDPFILTFGKRDLYVDFGAEQPIAAEKNGRKIAVEVKSFVGKTEAIFDTEKDHYELVHVGWRDKKRIHGSVIHIDIKDGKVWIQHDGTSDGIADELVEAGIPKEHIVLGFRHPKFRKYTEYAAIER